jgi:hypothetical protein
MSFLLRNFCFALPLGFAVSIASAGTDLFKEKVVGPPDVKLEEPWKFNLSMPGWMTGLYGDIGVGNNVSHVEVGFKDIINKIDMIFSMEGEVRKGPFDLRGSLFYYSASEGVGRKGLVKKIDARADQYIADLSFGYRLIEGEKGWLDLRVGARYINLYYRVGLQPNRTAIQETSETIVDNSASAVADEVRDALGKALDGDPDFPVPPLAEEDKQKLIAAAEAIRNDPELQAALASGVASRIAAAKKQATDKLSDALTEELSLTTSLAEDWFDPYIGLEGQYNFNHIFYVKVRTDIGGFGAGSEITWQVDGALGANISKNIYAEAGYRALGIDYDNNGFVYDTIMRGAEVTVGVRF